MMVVVADPRLVAGHHAERLDPPDQARRGQGIEDVVDGLAGDIGQSRRGPPTNRLGVGMRMIVHRLEHRDPGSGYAQIGPSKLFRVIRR